MGRTSIPSTACLVLLVQQTAFASLAATGVADLDGGNASGPNASLESPSTLSGGGVAPLPAILTGAPLALNVTGNGSVLFTGTPFTSQRRMCNAVTPFIGVWLASYLLCSTAILVAVVCGLHQVGAVYAMPRLAGSRYNLFATLWGQGLMQILWAFREAPRDGCYVPHQFLLIGQIPMQLGPLQAAPLPNAVTDMAIFFETFMSGYAAIMLLIAMPRMLLHFCPEAVFFKSNLSRRAALPALIILLVVNPILTVFAIQVSHTLCICVELFFYIVGLLLAWLAGQEERYLLSRLFEHVYHQEWVVITATVATRAGELLVAGFFHDQTAAFINAIVATVSILAVLAHLVLTAAPWNDPLLWLAGQEWIIYSSIDDGKLIQSRRNRWTLTTFVLSMFNFTTVFYVTIKYDLERWGHDTSHQTLRHSDRMTVDDLTQGRISSAHGLKGRSQHVTQLAAKSIEAQEIQLGRDACHEWARWAEKVSGSWPGLRDDRFTDDLANVEPPTMLTPQERDLPADQLIWRSHWAQVLADFFSDRVHSQVIAVIWAVIILTEPVTWSVLAGGRLVSGWGQTVFIFFKSLAFCLGMWSLLALLLLGNNVFLPLCLRGNNGRRVWLLIVCCQSVYAGLTQLFDLLETIGFVNEDRPFAILSPMELDSTGVLNAPSLRICWSFLHLMLAVQLFSTSLQQACISRMPNVRNTYHRLEFAAQRYCMKLLEGELRSNAQQVKGVAENQIFLINSGGGQRPCRVTHVHDDGTCTVHLQGGHAMHNVLFKALEPCHTEERLIKKDRKAFSDMMEALGPVLDGFRDGISNVRVSYTEGVRKVSRRSFGSSGRSSKEFSPAVTNSPLRPRSGSVAEEERHVEFDDNDGFADDGPEGDAEGNAEGNIEGNAEETTEGNTEGLPSQDLASSNERRSGSKPSRVSFASAMARSNSEISDSMAAEMAANGKRSSRLFAAKKSAGSFGSVMESTNTGTNTRTFSQYRKSIVGHAARRGALSGIEEMVGRFSLHSDENDSGSLARFRGHGTEEGREGGRERGPSDSTVQSMGGDALDEALVSVACEEGKNRAKLLQSQRKQSEGFRRFFSASVGLSGLMLTSLLIGPMLVILCSTFLAVRTTALESAVNRMWHGGAYALRVKSQGFHYGACAKPSISELMDCTAAIGDSGACGSASEILLLAFDWDRSASLEPSELDSMCTVMAGISTTAAAAGKNHTTLKPKEFRSLTLRAAAPGTDMLDQEGIDRFLCLVSRLLSEQERIEKQAMNTGVYLDNMTKEAMFLLADRDPTDSFLTEDELMGLLPTTVLERTPRGKEALRVYTTAIRVGFMLADSDPTDGQLSIKESETALGPIVQLLKALPKLASGFAAAAKSGNLESLNYTMAIQIVDINADGEVSRAEMAVLAAVLSAAPSTAPLSAQVLPTYDSIDEDGAGLLDYDEVEDLLRRLVALFPLIKVLESEDAMSVTDAQTLARAFDFDGNGVSRVEFDLIASFFPAAKSDQASFISSLIFEQTDVDPADGRLESHELQEAFQKVQALHAGPARSRRLRLATSRRLHPADEGAPGHLDRIDMLWTILDFAGTTVFHGEQPVFAHYVQLFLQMFNSELFSIILPAMIFAMRVSILGAVASANYLMLRTKTEHEKLTQRIQMGDHASYVGCTHRQRLRNSFAQSTSFPGIFIATVVINFFMAAGLIFVCMMVLITPPLLLTVPWTRHYFGELLLVLRYPLLAGLAKLILKRLVVDRLLVKQGQPIYPQLFAPLWLSLLLINFVQAPFLAVLRWCFLIVRGTVSSTRLHVCAFSDSLMFLDPGYAAFISLTFTQSTRRNLVRTCFISAIMPQAQRVKGTVPDPEEQNTEEAERRRRRLRVRNKLWVAVTLRNNPSLRQLRRVSREREFGSLTTLWHEAEDDHGAGGGHEHHESHASALKEPLMPEVTIDEPTVMVCSPGESRQVTASSPFLAASPPHSTPLSLTKLKKEMDVCDSPDLASCSVLTPTSCSTSCATSRAMTAPCQPAEPPPVPRACRYPHLMSPLDMEYVWKCRERDLRRAEALSSGTGSESCSWEEHWAPVRKIEPDLLAAQTTSSGGGTTQLLSNQSSSEMKEKLLETPMDSLGDPRFSMYRELPPKLSILKQELTARTSQSNTEGPASSTTTRPLQDRNFYSSVQTASSRSQVVESCPEDSCFGRHEVEVFGEPRWSSMTYVRNETGSITPLPPTGLSSAGREKSSSSKTYVRQKERGSTGRMPTAKSGGDAAQTTGRSSLPSTRSRPEGALLQGRRSEASSARRNGSMVQPEGQPTAASALDPWPRSPADASARRSGGVSSVREHSCQGSPTPFNVESILQGIPTSCSATEVDGTHSEVSSQGARLRDIEVRSPQHTLRPPSWEAVDPVECWETWSCGTEPQVPGFASPAPSRAREDTGSAFTVPEDYSPETPTVASSLASPICERTGGRGISQESTEAPDSSFLGEGRSTGGTPSVGKRVTWNPIPEVRECSPRASASKVRSPASAPPPQMSTLEALVGGLNFMGKRIGLGDWLLPEPQSTGQPPPAQRRATWSVASNRARTPASMSLGGAANLAANEAALVNAPDGLESRERPKTGWSRSGGSGTAADVPV